MYSGICPTEEATEKETQRESYVSRENTSQANRSL